MRQSAVVLFILLRYISFNISTLSMTFVLVNRQASWTWFFAKWKLCIKIEFFIIAYLIHNCLFNSYLKFDLNSDL